MMNRRELLKSAGLAMTASQVHGEPQREVAAADWLKTCRALICEAYNPPFYPSFDYQAEKAVGIATALNADSMRYPAASYFAYFPTKSGYPVHPELKGDPFRETVDLCKKNGMRVVAYVPLNHPFMDASSKDPRYAEWSKKFADGKPMTTEHYGFAKYFEGCLNSPVREVIRTLVREVLTGYPVDVMYFDGPYQGMNNAKEFCHCKYCEAAYQKRFGKAVPTNPDDVEYTEWMANEVTIGFLRDIREMIRTTRDVPVLFNDTSLLSKREWRNRAIPVVDGFMFEAAETPEDKLFNLQLGHSTG
ncbi:MAG: family 10 glycosylhydrolase, partial [Candidatus Solibacter sp.]|nr:family 10 glycosylhydrolase [Candidatus Solibacter sp.]